VPVPPSGTGVAARVPVQVVQQVTERLILPAPGIQPDLVIGD
jgi:hypothetical protein